MKKLLEKLNINPTFKDYRQVRYNLIELAQNIVQLEIGLASMKEEMKIYEAERVGEIKTKEQKITVKDLESIIKKELEEKNKEYLKIDAEMKIKKAQYDAIGLFLKAVDSSLYYLNNKEKNI